LIPVSTLFEELEEKEQRGLIADKWQYFVRLIEANALDELHGVVTVSVVKDGSKAEALQMMAKQNLTQLPVVDGDGRFVGTINQEKLASSILIEFLAQL
jgi:CBS domain-containing protein